MTLNVAYTIQITKYCKLETSHMERKCGTDIGIFVDNISFYVEKILWTHMRMCLYKR